MSGPEGHERTGGCNEAELKIAGSQAANLVFRSMCTGETLDRLRRSDAGKAVKGDHCSTVQLPKMPALQYRPLTIKAGEGGYDYRYSWGQLPQ